MRNRTNTLYILVISLALLSITSLFYKAVIRQDFDIISINEEEIIPEEHL